MQVKFDSTRKFGFELEFNNRVGRNDLARAINGVANENAYVDSYAHNYNNEEWCCKTDASCGYEVASRVLSGWKDLIKAGEVVDALKNAGVTADSRCGFHVHVEVRDFNRDLLGKLVAWWVKFEGIILNAMPNNRKSNHFCGNLSSRFRPNYRYEPSEAFNLADSSGRYSSLNVTNFSLRKTIEFRIAEGTNNSMIVKNWSRFLVHFVEIAKNLPMPENVNWMFPDEMIEILKLSKTESDGTPREFSDGMDETRQWLLDRVCENATDTVDKNIAKHVKECAA